MSIIHFDELLSEEFCEVARQRPAATCFEKLSEALLRLSLMFAIHYILPTLCRRSVINNKKPLWLRAPRECSETDYSEFYKQTFNAYDEPAAHAHFSVEGNVDFKVRAVLRYPN